MSDDKPTIPDSAPWWSKAIEVAIHTGGVSLLLVLFWMGQQAGWIPNPVEEELKELRAEVTAGFQYVKDGMQQNAGHDIRHDATMQEMVKHLDESMKRDQMRCILRAATDDEKKACFPSVSK